MAAMFAELLPWLIVRYLGEISSTEDRRNQSTDRPFLPPDLAGCVAHRGCDAGYLVAIASTWDEPGDRSWSRALRWTASPSSP